MTDDSNLLLAERLKQRAEFGLAKYGVALKPWDGRNTVVDAIEEALDLAVYLTKLDQERKNTAELVKAYHDLAAEALIKPDKEAKDYVLGRIAQSAGMLWRDLTADIPRIGSKSEAELERETWAAVKGPSERLADMEPSLVD